MTVTIHIEANSAAEARAEMLDLLNSPSPAATPRPVAASAVSEMTTGETDNAHEPAETPINGHIYGQAEEGKARRNKEQMAEDEEIERLAALHKITGGLDSAPASEVLKNLREMEAPVEDDAKANISTGEERKDPAQDEKPATREDMKAAMVKYVEAKGQVEAMEELPGIMGYKKQSEVPDDPAEFAKVIAKIEAAL